MRKMTIVFVQQSLEQRISGILLCLIRLLILFFLDLVLFNMGVVTYIMIITVYDQTRETSCFHNRYYDYKLISAG